MRASIPRKSLCNAYCAALKAARNGPLRLFYDHGTCHVAMKTTAVFVGAWHVKGSGKLIALLQGFRAESAGIADDAVHRLVLIDPGHLAASVNLDSGRRESKL